MKRKKRKDAEKRAWDAFCKATKVREAAQMELAKDRNPETIDGHNKACKKFMKALNRWEDTQKKQDQDQDQEE